MDKWRRKITCTLGALLFLAPAAVRADCGPCGPAYEFEAELIYWKPCVDDLDYAAIVEQNNGTEVDYKRICMDWEPGFRISLGMSQGLCSWDVSLSYTYLNACRVDSTTFANPDNANGVTSSLIHPELLSAELFNKCRGDYDLRYHSWDILFSYEIVCRECQHFKPFFGVAGLYLEQELDATFFGIEETEPGTVSWDSRYWGAGLKAGAEYVYQWNNCLGFFANANASLLVGEVDSKNRQEFSSSIDFDDGSCDCKFLPGYHIAAGLVYEGCCCSRPFELKLGYEFLNWHNVPNQRVFSGRADENGEISHSSSSNTRTLGFHGLLAGFSISF